LSCSSAWITPFSTEHSAASQRDQDQNDRKGAELHVASTLTPVSRRSDDRQARK
jgi:hypothetical protein